MAWRCAWTALLLALLLGILKFNLPTLHLEVLLLLYTTLDYWRIGLTFAQARRDLAYELASHPVSQHFVLIPNKRPLTEAIAMPLPGDDHITGICKTALYTELISDGGFSPFYHNLETADPVSAQERVRLFLEECRIVYEGLEEGGEYRTLLDGMRPGVRPNTTTPYPIFGGDPAKIRERAEVSSSRPDFSSRWVPEEELGPLSEAYVKHGFRPVRPEVVRGSEVIDAIAKGKVVKFDATDFMPKEFFNKSMTDFYEMHKDTADKIPLYRQSGASAPSQSGWESLTEYTDRVKKYRQAGSIRFPEYRPWFSEMPSEDHFDLMKQMSTPNLFMGLLNQVLKYVIEVDGPGLVRSLRQSSLQTAINLRRLPRAPQGLEKALGGPDWLERTWNMLWLGPVGDCWHFDDPDNLLIAVYGDIWVTVMENPEDNELLRASGSRGCWTGGSQYFPRTATSSSELEHHAWIKKFPAISFKLEPGMGVTVPSRVYHTLAMPSGDRVLMNSFFVPKFGKRKDFPKSEHGFYNEKQQSREYAALRSLKMTTVNRVWDKHGIGGWFEALKLEYL